MKVVGVTFNKVGKIYWFDPRDKKFEIGDKVVVETIRGQELSDVCLTNITIDEQSLDYEVKPVLRKADEEDLAIYEENLEEAKNSIDDIKQIVSESGLDMKVVGCEYTLDREKLIVFYTADGRIDFRELVRTLAREFQVRIELRQISSRDETKIKGGIGICGLQTCCSRHLREIDFVTMKDAKTQDLNLSSGKSMGVCGKLMCCINYEVKLYEEAKKIAPQSGMKIKTKECNCAEVISVNYVSGIITAKPYEGDTLFKTKLVDAVILTEKEFLKEKTKGITFKEELKPVVNKPENADLITDSDYLKKSSEFKKQKEEQKKKNNNNFSSQNNRDRNHNNRHFNRNNKKKNRGDVEVTTVVIPKK